MGVLLDQKTLLLVVTVITLLIGILMLHFVKNNPSIPGPLYWSAGSFFISVATGVYLFYPQVESYFVLVFGGTSAVLGLSLYFAGIQAFNQVKLNYWLILAFPLFELLQGTFFYLVIPMPYMRITLYSIINVLISLFVIREFLRAVSKPYINAYFAGILVFIVFTIIHLIRSYFAFSYRIELTKDLGNVNANLFFFNAITQTILLFVFVLMISIRLSEKLNEKIADQQTLFSIIGHDLTGHIGSISQLLGLINEPGNFDKKHQKYILKDLEKMSVSSFSLLQNLLLWSKNNLQGINLNIQKFNLNKLIEDNLSLMSQSINMKNIKIDCDAITGLQCRGDEQMINTVIRNVISNAIKFTRNEGKISIVCENAGQNIRIKISDNGIGMSEETRLKLFDFHETVSETGTSGEKGTGLGLMLCKEFVEANHGSIRIKSQKNLGTEVIIELPADYSEQIS